MSLLVKCSDPSNEIARSQSVDAAGTRDISNIIGRLTARQRILNSQPRVTTIKNNNLQPSSTFQQRFPYSGVFKACNIGIVKSRIGQHPT